MPDKDQPWLPSRLLELSCLGALEPFVHHFARFQAWPTLADYTHLLAGEIERRAPDCPNLEFSLAKSKPRRARRFEEPALGTLYDGSIFLEKKIPCFPRSYHDLFNAVIWAAFPRSKHALHTRQFQALKSWVPAGERRLPGARTREQDALTVFDEGGSVVVGSQGFGPQSATDMGASTSFSLGSRAPFQVVLFGHALLEHAFYGRPTVRSSAVAFPVEGPIPTGLDLLELIDNRLCSLLASQDAFREPGLDAIVELDQAGSISIKLPAGRGQLTWKS